MDSRMCSISILWLNHRKKIDDNTSHMPFNAVQNQTTTANQIIRPIRLFQQAAYADDWDMTMAVDSEVPNETLLLHSNSVWLPHEVKAEGSVCGGQSMVFCLCMKISKTAERICIKFTRKTCLVPHSDEFEGQGQRLKVKVSRDKNGIFRPFRRPACGSCLPKHL